jgi:malate synthase
VTWGNGHRQDLPHDRATVGVSDLDIHLLMNHSVVGANADYINRNELLRDHLRQQQERISRKAIDAVQPRPNAAIERKPPVWPLLPARRIPSDLLAVS